MPGLHTLSPLLDWCADNGIWIDRRIAVVEDVDNGGLRVQQQSRFPIGAHETLVTIPKTAVLSVRSCSFAEVIPVVPYGHGARLGLSLAVYGELLLGERSRWFGYLQSLPRATVGIALLWGTGEAWADSIQGQEVTSDGRQAAVLAAGTEIEREFRGEDGENIMDEVRQYYTGVVAPALSSPSPSRQFTSPPALSFSGFLHAYSLVSSRAFLVDAYHSLAMVPIADAFNHTLDNHVHLESEFDVCVRCGSLAQCAHDTEDDDADGGGKARDAPAQPPHADASPLQRRTARSTACAEHDSRSAGPSTQDGRHAPDTCDMVANAPVPPGQEVFNTYGEHLANAQLLARYGFALDGNDNDVVAFDADDLPAPAACSPAALRALFGRVLEAMPRGRRWESSGLVYQPEAAGGASSRGVHMCVNSDGRVSHALWVYCATVAVVAQDARLLTAGAHAAAAAAARRLAGAQLLAEGPLTGAPGSAADDDEGGGDLPRHEGTAKADKDALDALARTVAWCCRLSPRAQRLGRPVPAARGALSSAALGALLDPIVAASRPVFVSPLCGLARPFPALQPAKPCAEGARPAATLLLLLLLLGRELYARDDAICPRPVRVVRRRDVEDAATPARGAPPRAAAGSRPLRETAGAGARCVVLASSAGAAHQGGRLELPDAHTKTRLAIAQVLAERSLLASCAAAWDDLRGGLRPDSPSPPPPPPPSTTGLGALAGYGSEDSG
ncbi:hypothetical protein PHLGIDRAFT_119783 [Phlebiopsis gigantea 11061_1 CR5-6]|uniref:SET domain-containing protein n=1 Tax=Phlebiopsis gigantea (strain 11061_1 CR5-6) TaxID=745531 RepID=A0A0C3S8N2_PHLG1|nr:hypothetical protein PHLGIDRAFT_119783 [Phlebiopsis gigantea 11061_1 CR5-6]